MLLWSGVGGQLLSIAVVRVSGQLLSHHLLWSGAGGQLLSHHLLWSGVGGQLLCNHLLRSRVGGQLLSYHVGGQFSAQPFSADLLSYHVAVVRGWWSAIG